MDRKAWIVIVLCCIGLAVNFYFSGQNREALLEQQQKEEQAEKKRQEQERKAAEARDVDPSGDAGAPVPELTEPPEQVVEEKTVILSTSGAVFTFTTHGGGIKHVEMLGQYEVGDEENQVRINGEGEHPIGVLTNAPRFSAYVASKSALDAFSRCLSPEVASRNIDLTTIYMPLVRTPMIAPTKIYDYVPTLTPEQAADYFQLTEMLVSLAWKIESCHG